MKAVQVVDSAVAEVERGHSEEFSDGIDQLAVEFRTVLGAVHVHRRRSLPGSKGVDNGWGVRRLGFMTSLMQ